MTTDIFRTDILTRKKFHKKDLVRIVILKDQRVIIDHHQSINGRGIYFYAKSLRSEKQLNILKKEINKRGGDYYLIADELKLMLRR